MAALTGLFIADSYKALLKTVDNDVLGAAAKEIVDGYGNVSGVLFDTSGNVTINGNFRALDAILDSSGNAGTAGQVLTTTGTTTQWQSLSSVSGVTGSGTAGYLPLWSTNSALTNSIAIQSGATITIGGTLTATTKINTPILQLTGGLGTQGTLSWNADEETVDLVQNGTTTPLNQATELHVKNQTGATIAKGTPVRAAGTLGASGRILIAPMIANGTIEAKYFLGVTNEAIADGEEGKVITFGKIKSLNTAAYTEGQTLWVSSTVAGAFTTTRPVAPNLDLEVAIVINSHVNNGTIFVRATNGHYLGTAHDVNISSVAENDLLVYKTNRWVNSKTIGDLTAANVTLSGYLRGPATFVIDPAAYGDETGLVQILGDLRVDGTTTTINSTTISVSDKNITLAKDAVTAGDANGAGITIAGANATLTYLSATDDFTFNKNVNASRFFGPLTGNVTGTVSTLSNHDTDDLDEGTTNLYFTTARARDAFSAGTGVAINAGEISIGQSVGTTDDVTFDVITATGGTSTEWNAAYDYSQVGHLPLSGGTITGNLDVDGIIDNTRNNTNAAPPSISDHTVGTRIKLWDSSDVFFYALGIESGHLWSNADIGFKWYERAVEKMSLSNGNLTIVGTIAASGYNNTNWDSAYSYSQIGHLPLTGGTLTGQLTLDDKLTITGTTNNLVIDEEADGTWHLYDTFQENGIVLHSGSGGMDFQYNGVTEMTIDGAGVSFTGTINLDAADLNIGSADIIFDTTAGGATRGLIWNVSGSGFLSKIVSGGADNGKVTVFTNIGDGITAGDVFVVRNGADTPLSISHDNVISTVGGTSTEWNEAYSWGDHAGLYLPLAGKAADSELLDGIDSSRVVYGSGANKSTAFDGGNINTALASGFYDGLDMVGAPTASTYYHLIHARHNNTANNFAMQLAGAFYSDTLYYRQITNNVASAWRTIIHSGNIGSQSVSYATSAGTATDSTKLPLTGGTITGDLIVDGELSVTGTIDLSNADLNIGAADIIFDTISTGANRGLIWNVSPSGFLSKLVGGGADGGKVTLFANMDDAITAGNIFEIKDGSTGSLFLGLSHAGILTAGGGTSTQWNTAYSYSQIGHLPLSGGTLTGALTTGRVTISNNVSAGGFTSFDDYQILLYQSSLGFAQSYGIGIESETMMFNSDNRYRFYVDNVVKATIESNGSLILTGGITASGYNNTNWDTAFGWGDHDGLYLPLSGKAADSELLDGLNSTAFIRNSGYANQTEYSILDNGSINGPAIKIRYDGATANRWWDIGYKDGNGTYYEGLKGYNNSTLTWVGQTIIHSGNISSQSVNYAVSAGAATTSITFVSDRTNYKGYTDNAVSGQLMWKQYGNFHTIFDASAGTSPSGTTINRHTPDYPVLVSDGNNSWGVNPNLMAWNGANTYGVKVDWSRYSEISGEANLATTANNALALSGYALDGATSVATRIFNNKGQVHGTYTDFNTAMTPGPNYLQGGTNSPSGVANSQWYGFLLGLGSEYNTETGNATSYASQLYWSRQGTPSPTPYLWARDMEGGTWGSWRKMSAGYSDTAGSALVADVASTANYATNSGSTNSVIWGNVSSTPTTLQGYGITSGYITGEVGIGTTSPNNKLTVAWTDPNALSVYRDLDINVVGAAGTYINMGARDGASFKNGARLAGALNNSTDGAFYIDTLRSGTLTTAVSVLGNGSVGIGISPSAKLEVAGEIRATGAKLSTNDIVYIDKGASDSIQEGSSVYLVGNTGSSYTQLQQGVGRFTIWGYNGSSWGEKMTVRHSDGNVGIGVTSPAMKLSVAGGILAAGSGGNNLYGVYVSPTNENTFNSGYGTDDDTRDLWLNYRGYNDGFTRFRTVNIGNGKGTAFAIFHGPTGNTYLSTGGGKVGVGITTPAAKLEVRYGGGNGNVGLSDYGIVTTCDSINQATIGSVHDGDGYANLNLGSNEGSNKRFWHISKRLSADSHRLEYYYYTTESSFASRFAFMTNGDFHADGDVIAYSSTISDQRLKDDVKTIDNALDKVKAMRGVEYVWNEGSRKGQKDLGLIAQEVEQVLPEIVREKETIYHGEKGKYKTVDYEKIVGVLIEAIKELSAEVEQLKNKK